MALVQRFDTGRLSKATRTGSGGARVPASIARTGIQTYTDSQGNTVREYRAPDVVFDPQALASLASIPVTIGHPGSVDAGNWRRHAVGHVSDAPTARRQDGNVEWLDTAIVVQDAAALARIERGELVEVSMGYLANVVPRAGVTPTGEHYDAVQEAIVFNHLALLGPGKARAGSGARLRLDGNEAPESDADNEEIMKVKIDGIEYDVGSTSHIQALERQLGVATARADKAEADAKSAAEQLGKAQAKADAADVELAKLKAQDVNALVLDELNFRAGIVAALPQGYAFEGKSRDQVRADAVGPEVVAKAAALPEAARFGYIQYALEAKLAAPVVTPKTPLHSTKADAKSDEKPAKRKDPVAEAYAASWTK